MQGEGGQNSDLRIAVVDDPGTPYRFLRAWPALVECIAPSDA